MKRIPALDSIRGLLLVIMTINHLIWISGGQSALQYFTLQPLGQFGAAEGFILISGLLAGAVYSRRELSDGEAKRKVWHRAFTIYKYHVASLFVVMLWFTFCVALLPSLTPVFGASFNNLTETPLLTLALSALLVNKPDYLEILPLYIMFMLVLPLALYAYRRGYVWLVLLVSTGVWALSNSIQATVLAPVFNAISPDLSVQFGYFDPFAWQLLFIGGSAIGYFMRKGTLVWYHPVVAVVAAVLAGLLFAAHHHAFLSFGIHQGVLYSMADKPELGWLRILNLALWVYLVAVIIRKAPNLLDFRPLGYIGRQSLQVFTWQAVLIYISAPLLTEMRHAEFYIAVVLALTATLWIAAWLQNARKSLGFPLLPASALSSIFVIVLATGMAGTGKQETVTIAENEHYPLTIKIEQIKDDAAPVMVLVYKESDVLFGTPTAHARPYSVEEVKNGVTIDTLPAGYYGVMAFQDTDGNMTLTMGAGGLPAEGFGFSNNPTLQGTPNMEQIKFAHTQAQNQTIYLTNLF